MGVTSWVWQIRLEGATVNVSGILHCTALWKDLNLLYSLLFFTRAFLFALGFISRGWRRQYWFSATSPGCPPLHQRLFTTNTCKAWPAGPFWVLRGNPNARALIPPWPPSSNDGCCSVWCGSRGAYGANARDSGLISIWFWLHRAILHSWGYISVLLVLWQCTSSSLCLCLSSCPANRFICTILLDSVWMR